MGGGDEPRLTHIGPDGSARMVDVGAKAESERRAIAEARVRMEPETAPCTTMSLASRLPVIRACCPTTIRSA